MSEKWCWSHNGETYQGDCDSREEAIEEARAEAEEGATVWVGKARAPRIGVRAWRLIEEVEDNDEEAFCGDSWVEDDWPKSTRQQDDELEAAVAKVVCDWLDRHGLRPRWFAVEDSEEVPS